MSAKTAIEWTDASWNPVTGCTKVSPGCDHCYAETLAERFRDTPGHYFEHGFDVQLRPDKLDQPLRWKKPKRIFVNSMSDLFHDEIPDDYIARVWAVMAATPQHTYQVLTKRHGRMRSFLRDECRCGAGHPAGAHLHSKMMWAAAAHSPEHVPGLTSEAVREGSRGITWGQPLANVELGVSVETQQWADIRIPALLDTPAAVRFLSCEPLLGPVDLDRWLDQPPETGGNKWLPDCGQEYDDGSSEPVCQAHGVSRCSQGCRFVDWVIVGGESGRGARPMHPDWARNLRDQCTAAGVPFLFKQWGEWAPNGWSGIGVMGHREVLVGEPDEHGMRPVLERVGKKAAGRELDGRTWDEFPGAVS